MILHQIEALVKAGVKHIILAVNYKPEVMVSHIKQYEKTYGIKISISVEDEPLGTAGPLALARDLLTEDDEPFFVLNSDIICEFPFDSMIKCHKSHGGEGTIFVTKVEEPSKYGVVVCSLGSSAIERFVEKPVEYVSNRINAGIYMFSTSMLNRIQPKPTSIEKEIFPKMATDCVLHAIDLKGFWMDVGQPRDYLAGVKLYLASLWKNSPEHLSSGENISGNVLIHPSAKIGKNCLIGPNVTIGPDAVIRDGVRIAESVILECASVDSYSWIQNSIVGWNSRIGKWARVEGVSVLGDDVTVQDEIYINGGCILPHKSISASISDPQIVM